MPFSINPAIKQTGLVVYNRNISLLYAPGLFFFNKFKDTTDTRPVTINTLQAIVLSIILVGLISVFFIQDFFFGFVSHSNSKV